MPAELPRQVFVTSAGDVYHRTATCTLLLQGQRKRARAGCSPSEPTRVARMDAIARGIGACMGCLGNVDTQTSAPGPGARSCQVRINGAWHPGWLLEWSRSEDGAWFGRVEVTVGRQRHKLTKAAVDLRPARDRPGSSRRH